MNRPPLHLNCRLPIGARQQGVTLIELLVSIALGMIVIAAVLVIYTSGSNATRNAQAQGQMNEDAQMALDSISQELRRAGYNPTLAGGVVNDLGQSGWGITACDTGFVDASLTGMAALTCNGSGNMRSPSRLPVPPMATGFVVRPLTPA